MTPRRYKDALYLSGVIISHYAYTISTYTPSNTVGLNKLK